MGPDAAEAALSFIVTGLDDAVDIEPFCVPPGHILMGCPALSVKELKKAGKFAYKFPEGWEVGTFRGQYKGKEKTLKGNFELYFSSFKPKVAVKLVAEEYGSDKIWVVFKAKKP